MKILGPVLAALFLVFPIVAVLFFLAAILEVMP